MHPQKETHPALLCSLCQDLVSVQRRRIGGRTNQTKIMGPFVLGDPGFSFPSVMKALARLSY